jgi:hypothetical protein
MIGVALALGLIAGQSAQSASVSEELKQIEAELAAAWKRGECETWGAFLAPDWSVIHVTGDVITRPRLWRCARHGTRRSNRSPAMNCPCARLATRRS